MILVFDATARTRAYRVKGYENLIKELELPSTGLALSVRERLEQ